jgi:sugar phosphate isomerase/epimerase
LSKPAFTASITAPLPLVGDQPRFAPASLKTWGCDGAELRRHQVAPLSGPHRKALRQDLNEAGLATAFITSSDEAGEGWSLEALREALALAAFFGAECVVTGAPPRGSNSTIGEREAAEWLEAATALAEAGAIPLLVENRPGTWADTGRGFNQFMGQAVSPWLRTAFDPAGFVALREHPFLTAFMPGHLKSRLHVLRIRDARFADGCIVPVNHGNAEIAELVSAALARSFGGFFAVGTPDAGPDEVRQALADFKQLLVALGLERLTNRQEMNGEQNDYPHNHW